MEFLKRNRVLALGLLFSLLIHFLFVALYFSKNERTVSLIPLETLLYKIGATGPEKIKHRPSKVSSSDKVPSQNQNLESQNHGQEEGTGGNQEALISSFVEAKALESLEPSYPELSRRKGEEGLCVVKTMITHSGIVQAVTIEKSSGFKRLDESALNQVKRTHFSPALQKGVAVASEKQIIFKFELKK